jgi:predicted transposase YbfD/YdcC
MKLKNFSPYELVPKETYLIRGDKALQLMDKELLVFIDTLRTELGKSITINDWKWGGSFQYRGLRVPASEHFKQYSQHTYGKALDFDVKGMSAEQVRQWIIDNRDLDWVKPVSFIETDVNWVHVDTRPIPENQLWLWSPKTNVTTVFNREVI